MTPPIPETDYDYSGLFALMFEVKFEVTKFVPHDVNRAMDGLVLQGIFEEETGMVMPYLGPCRMLEFLIALARRMDEQVWENNSPDQTRKFFWILLSSLELDMWPNTRLEKEGEGKVRHILGVLNNRAYANDGSHGGLFPLKNPTADQREEEIWYQMMSWFLEKG